MFTCQRCEGQDESSYRLLPYGSQSGLFVVLLHLWGNIYQLKISGNFKFNIDRADRSAVTLRRETTLVTTRVCEFTSAQSSAILERKAHYTFIISAIVTTNDRMFQSKNRPKFNRTFVDFFSAGLHLYGFFSATLLIFAFFSQKVFRSSGVVLIL